jgi:hypothetical protein
MKASLKAMAEVGGRAIALIVAETVFLAIFVLVIAYSFTRQIGVPLSTVG